MTDASQPFYQALDSLGQIVGDPLPVTMSPELITLLSDQLYRSPSKAIEELVVNGFDAGADEARVFVPGPVDDEPFIVVYDDGEGMTYNGLADLWRVGRPKPRNDTPQRKQIGKFGIGKLATYAVANRVTYVTKTDGQHLAVTVDYRDFTSNPSTTATPVGLNVHEIRDLGVLWDEDVFRAAVEATGLDKAHLLDRPSWTVVILEDLKEKARTMGFGRLRWVLSTAMPLSVSFKLFLNGEEVESSKEDHTRLVEFDIGDLPQSRLDALSKNTGEEWSAKEGCLVAESFPSGVWGSVMVTLQTLSGKSDELVRSGGFFVYVRERLVNEEDARFGLHAYSHTAFNRFRADVHIDDLDQILTANRESMGNLPLYRDAQALLNEVFNEARTRYGEHYADMRRKSLNAREHKKNWVPERLVELPTADVLTDYSRDFEGAEADESWMYLKVDPDNIAALTKSLYSETGRKQPYTYRYEAPGRLERLVQFDPSSATFTINQDHELVATYAGDPQAQSLLHDLVTSEALLEVYLREAGVRPHTIGEVLERRDKLLRGLAKSHLFSLTALGDYISNSADNESDLEIAVVAGARALGFVAKHIGGKGQPDGIARFTDFPEGEQTITLEAKSSIGTPSAKDIDFSAIKLHMQEHDADGCLLVAPGYQGDDDGNAARSAVNERVSCWTVKQYADVIRGAEARHISARQILDIVREKFTPQDVEKAVDDLLAEPTWEQRGLYLAVARALRNLHSKMVDAPRNVAMIGTEIAGMDGFRGVKQSAVHKAVADLAGASKGALVLRESGDVVLNVAYEELERRVQDLTGVPGSPRRKGAFGEVAGDEE